MKNTEKNRRNGMRTAVLWAVFIFYLLFLIRIVLFKQVRIDNLAAAFGSGFRSLSLIPFSSIFGMLGSEMTASRLIENIAGNIALFVPFGLLVPVLVKRKKGCYGRAVLAGTALSICFETMQYIFWMGSADIDDVILNAAGVLAGCGICALLRKTAVRLRISFESAVLAVAVVLGVIGLTAVFISDSSLFLLSTKNVTTVNEEIVKDFIDMEDDAHGSFISFSGMKLTIEQKIAYGDNEAVLQENSLFEVQEEGSSFEGKGEETALEPGTAAASEDEVSETDSAAKSERKVFEVNEDSEIYVCSVHLECIFDNVIGERIVYERLELDELVRNSSDVFGGCSQIRIWSRDGDKADRILITQID